MSLSQHDMFWKVLEGMVERRDSPDSETWLLLLNAVDTAGALDKAVELMERSRAEGHGSAVRNRKICRVSVFCRKSYGVLAG